MSAVGPAPFPRAPAMPGRGAVRLRLTVLYGVLFLASGAALLAITYALVTHATSRVLVSGSGGSGGSGVTATAPGTPAQLPGPDQPVTRQVKAYADSTRAAENDALLLYSGVALTIMTVASGWLGWFAAGRALRPLETSYEAQRQFVAVEQLPPRPVEKVVQREPIRAGKKSLRRQRALERELRREGRDHAVGRTRVRAEEIAVVGNAAAQRDREILALLLFRHRRVDRARWHRRHQRCSDRDHPKPVGKRRPEHRADRR